MVIRPQQFNRIRNGDVLAFRSRSLWSKLIRFRTMAPVSHVGFAYWLEGRLAVIEAKDWYYIRVWPLDRYLEDKSYEVDHYELLDEQYKVSRTHVVRQALKLWGSRYANAWQFLRSWGIIGRRIGDWLGWSKDTDEGRYHCSETILTCLVAGGYCGEGFEKSPAEVTPGDIVRLPCLHRTGVIRFSD